jgi:hypothetical protein
MWSSIFDIQIARYKDCCLYKTRSGFWFPAGRGVIGDCGEIAEISEIIEVLREYGGGEVLFTNVPADLAETLKTMNPAEITANRDYFDYVYDYQSLATLAGRKLHGKRNHLHRFYENDWSFEPITPCNIEEVTDMHNRWCDAKGVYSDPEALREAGAVVRGLDSFFDLGFIGGAIRVNGEICAYTFGSPIGNRCNDTFTVHVEKAFAEIQGIYTGINKEFINYAGEQSDYAYCYVNREEDMGVPNLRKAKLSYRPAFLLEKHRVLFR